MRECAVQAGGLEPHLEWSTTVKNHSGVAAFAAIALLPLGLTATSAATTTGADITSLVSAQPDEKNRYKDKAAKVKEKKEKKIDQADRDAAAARALQQGALNPLMMVEAAATPILDNGVQVPRYFSHPNYANSPLPTVESGTQVYVGNELIVRPTATDGATNVFVVLAQHPLPAGFLKSFQIRSQVEPPRDFHAYVLRPDPSLLRTTTSLSSTAARSTLRRTRPSPMASPPSR